MPANPRTTAGRRPDTTTAGMLDILGMFMGPVAAVLIGAEAGAGDTAAGVFRDNVITGRSRLALFLRRIPAALVVTMAVDRARVRVRPGRACSASPVGCRRRACHSILESAAWLALANGVVCVIAIGLASSDGLAPGHDHRADRMGAGTEPVCFVASSSLGSARSALLDGVLVSLKPGPATARYIDLDVGGRGDPGDGRHGCWFCRRSGRGGCKPGTREEASDRG